MDRTQHKERAEALLERAAKYDHDLTNIGISRSESELRRNVERHLDTDLRMAQVHATLATMPVLGR